MKEAGKLKMKNMMRMRKNEKVEKGNKVMTKKKK